MTSTSSGRRAASGELARLLVLAAAVGLALRAWEAAQSSLWLDELHTLVHASQPSLGAVSESVRRDLHSPLFFWAVHFLGGWEQGAWLRALPVATSLLMLVPLVAIARGSGGVLAAALAAWLFATLPYQVHFDAELRPYAWVAVLSVGAFYAAFSERETRFERFLLFLACAFLGLWTHRLMVITVFAIGAARLFARRPGMLGLGWLVLAGAVAAVPVVPWLLGFAETVTEMRFDHQDAHGGWKLRSVLVKEVVSLPARLAVPFMGALGSPWSHLARAGAALFFAAALATCALWVIQRRRGQAQPLSPQLRGAILFAGIAFVLVTAASIYSWDRVPLQYYAILTWAIPLALAALCASLRSGAVRKALALSLAGSGLALGVAQAGGREPEDMRGAVQAAREIGQSIRAGEGIEPVYTALLAQPDVFENVLPYRAYGPELGAVEPASLPQAGDPGFERPVVLVLRQVPRSRESWRPVLSGRRVEREVEIDWYLSVLVLRPE
ncbi:MAG TPA: hypothetical protein VMS76_18020 [Planctomycetota bacterium]|nr:hypothetical protein [Planctomycetota bacterium]